MAKSFRMRQKTLEWFSKLYTKQKKQHPLKREFDLYYFCLMIGLASGRYSHPSEESDKWHDFLNYFLPEYEAQQNLIIGLLIKAILKDFGISLNDRDETKKFLQDYLDPKSLTHLSDKGMDKMNEYASGGFDYLTEHLDKPYVVEDFLISYVKILQQAINNNDCW